MIIHISKEALREAIDCVALRVLAFEQSGDMPTVEHYLTLATLNVLCEALGIDPDTVHPLNSEAL